jgi:CRISPR-associated endoribonuclease Cas6
MVARLEIKLAAKEPLSNQMASVFQGVLMELLPEKYAAYLHESSLHPYSQHLEMKDKCWYWVINCLNQEATEIILMNVLMKKNSIMLKKQKLEVKFTEKRYSELGDKELLHNFYNEEKSRYLNLHFITPTAFKQAGKYLFYPDLRCMYQSCMQL